MSVTTAISSSPSRRLRALRAPSVLLLLAPLSACGGSEEPGAAASPASSTSASRSASASQSASSHASPSASTSASADADAAANGACGDGAYPTTVVTTARGVRLTVPRSWRVREAKGGAAVGLYPPNGGSGDGYVLVEASDQTIEQAVQETLAATRDSAQTIFAADLDLAGFDDARVTTFAYDDGAFSVDVTAVGKGVRVQANLTDDERPAEQAMALSCLSSLALRR